MDKSKKDSLKNIFHKWEASEIKKIQKQKNYDFPKTEELHPWTKKLIWSGLM